MSDSDSTDENEPASGDEGASRSQRIADLEMTARQRADMLRERKHAARQLRREERRERRRNRPRVKKLRFALVTIGLCALAMVSWMFGILMAVAQDLPDLEAKAQFDRAQNSVVYAKDGETQIATLTGNQQRILLESSEIDQTMKQAVVAIEDERFYEHRGIDYLGLARALREDILSGSAAQGGSTITQQFVKNALAAQDERTVLQKLKESALAYQIERQWTKDKILTNYLNNIYFGQGAYGIEAAARTYFGANHPGCGDEGNRCAQVLAVEEAALLAGMIASPTAYDPEANPNDSQERRNIVLQKMRELGYLQYDDEAFEELLDISVPAPSQIEPPTEPSTAPYFTDWLRQQVVDKYGAGEAFGGGLEITSTLDAELQQAAQDVVTNRLSGLGPTAAVVAIDNESGEVRAMVGGSDFENSPFNLATNGQRQPGSSFKPFTLVTALANGKTPADVYESRPIEIPFENTITTEDGERKTVNELFEVNNYDDNYLGTATIQTATTYSDNSVYAQLGTEIGTEKIADMAGALGIQSRIDDNPAMILGGLKRGVTPLEMAYAFTTIANDGSRLSGTMASRGNGKGPVAIAEVTTGGENPGKADGELASDDLGATGANEVVEEPVVDPAIATQAREILHTVVTDGTGVRAQVGDDYIWGKTGTTDNNADAWFVGANDDLTVAVWVGYADGAIPMETEFGGLPVDGGTIPALIWNDVVTAFNALEDARQADNPVEEEELAPETAPVPTETTPVVPEEVAPEVTEEPPPPEEVPEAPAPETPATEPPAEEEAPVTEGGADPTAG
jgi:penicillin-binding protein 1A